MQPSGVQVPYRIDPEVHGRLKDVHGSDEPAGRVGSGHDFAGFWRVGSGRVSTSEFKVFLLIICWYLNRFESSNTAFRISD